MSKYLDLAGLTAYDGKIKQWFKSGLVDITDDEIRALFVTVAEGPADNEIWYTSSDGNVVNPVATNPFVTANIVSNTYENGKGVIKFDGPVTSIGEWAFIYCSSLTSITIPNSVTSIGSSAFSGCSSLMSIVIPNDVKSIEWETFDGCSSLTFVTIPNSVTSIGGAAFRGCKSLTCVVIPNSVTEIGDYAFYDCFALNSVTIGNSVTSIGYEAFSECWSITSIIFEGTIKEWGNIDKGVDWNRNVPATYVQCSDGQAPL
jgi:hypothetical protein